MQLLLRSRAVVAAAGALHTPALLLRSGIKGNGNVGRHLRLHPAFAALGFFESGAPGATLLQTSLALACTHTNNLRRHLCLHPAAAALCVCEPGSACARLSLLSIAQVHRASTARSTAP